MSGVRFLIVALAAYRMTRLVTLDKITGPIRIWVAGVPEGEEIRSWPRRWLFALLGCSWCAGFWISGGAVLLAQEWTSMPLPVAQWFACSTIVGLIGSRDG